MSIDFVHVRIGTANVAIFNADAQNHTKHGRQEILAALTARAQLSNLRVDRSVLAFTENGRLNYFGDPDTVRYLTCNNLVYQPNHRLTV